MIPSRNRPISIISRTVEVIRISTLSSAPVGAGNHIELRVPSKAEYVSIVRSVVTDLARSAEMSPSEVEDLQVAVSEACANVVRHAYPGGDSDGAELLVRFSSEDGGLITEVIDNGCGFDGGDHRQDPDSNGGLGLVLIQALMDQVLCCSSPEFGTAIRMVKFSSD